MSGTDETRALRAELRDLYEDYAACLDEMELERWAAFFTDDGLYRVTSRENHAQGLELSALSCVGGAMIRDRVAAIRTTIVYQPRALRHMVSGVRVEEAGETIRASANFLLTECLSDQEPTLLMVGRYLDRLVREGGALKFKERICVYDNYRIRTSLIIPV